MSDGPLLELGFTGSDLPLVRVTLAAALRRAGLPEPMLGAIVQAGLEAASNAVVHGGGAGRLVVRAVDGEVRCEVTDLGPGPAAVLGSAGTPAAVRGNGLRLAELLVERLEMRAGPGGKGTTVALAVPWQGSPVAVR